MELHDDPQPKWIRAAGLGVSHVAPTPQRSKLIEQEGQWRRVRAVNPRRLNSRLLRVDLDIAWALADGRTTPVGTGTCACRGSTWRCGDHGCDSRRRNHRCDNARFDSHRESLTVICADPRSVTTPNVGSAPNREDPVGLQPVQRGRAGRGSRILKNFRLFLPTVSPMLAGV
jgi:hypothetical protein